MPTPEAQTRPQIPPTGFVRIKTILQFIPVSASTWWAGCRTGRYPRAIKLGRRTTVWKSEDILALIQELGLDQEGGEA